MDLNIITGGAAGLGIETLSSIMEKVFAKAGFHVFTVRDYMSRVRGGHNFITIRISDSPLYSHSERIDMLIALDNETIKQHRAELTETTVIICDEELSQAIAGLPSAVCLPLKKYASETGSPRFFGSVAAGVVFSLTGFITEYAKDLVFKVMKDFLGDAGENNFRSFLAGIDLWENNSNNYNFNLNPGIKFPDTDYSRSIKNSMLINANEAIALGAIASNVRFYSAYPMTPATSIMNYLASKAQDYGMVIEQAEDEIAAVNMAIGASFAGVSAMTGTSGGGFCLMTEGMGLSGMAEIPLVIAEVQRPGPVTGFPTRTEQADLRFVVHASHGEFPRMIVAPRNAEDAFFQTIRAFDIAERYQIPVVILSDQYLADTTATTGKFDIGSSAGKYDINTSTGKSDIGASAGKSDIGTSAGKFDLNTSAGKLDIGTSAGLPVNTDEGRFYKPQEGEIYKRYKFSDDGISPRLIPGMYEDYVTAADSDEHDEYGKITESAQVRIAQNNKRLAKFTGLEKEVKEPWLLGHEYGDILLVAWGSIYGAVREFVETYERVNKNSSLKVTALVYGDVWPLPVSLFTRLAQKAKAIINIEQNATGQLAGILTEKTGILFSGNILKYDGRQMTSEYIKARLEEIHFD